MTKHPKRGRKDRPWTPDCDATLASMKAAGMTVAVIGERLGRTPNAVSSRRTDAIDARPKPPPRDFLGEKVEAYLARVFKLNRSQFTDIAQLKQEAYGWR